MKILFGVLLCCLAALPAHAQTDTIYQYQGADREAKLIEGAKKEGTLLLYTSMAPTESNQIAQAFEKKYGIKVQVWRNLSETVLQRTIAEARARRHAVDVIETNAPEVEVLVQENLVSEFNSPHVAGLHPFAVPPHRKYVSDRVNLFVVAFNTQKVKREEIPATYEGFADPKWRGKLAIESKRDMKARGVTSPDKADAVFGCMTPLRRMESFNLGNRGPAGSFTEQLREFNETEAAESPLPGCHFG